MLENTTDFCEQIVLEADMLVADVKNLITAPEVISYQGQISKSLEQAIGNISAHAENLYGMIYTNIDHLASAQSIQKYRNHYSRSNGQISQGLNRLQNADNKLGNDLDTKLAAYTGMKGV